MSSRHHSCIKPEQINTYQTKGREDEYPTPALLDEVGSETYAHRLGSRCDRCKPDRRLNRKSCHAASTSYTRRRWRNKREWQSDSDRRMVESSASKEKYFTRLCNIRFR